MLSTFSDVESHVIERVRAAAPVTEPFDHCVVDDVFPEEFLEAIHKQWPGEDVMMSIADTGRTDAYRERFVMLYEKRFFTQLTTSQQEFWALVLQFTTGAQVLQACFSKFKDRLRARVQHLKGEIQLRPELLVVSDRSNYAIGPHTDLPSRLMTLLFYLSPGDEYESYGTSLYVPKDENRLDGGRTHHPFGEFDRHSRVDYVPNRAVIFPRTDKSFHGVEPVPVNDCDRRLLIVNVRAPEGAVP